MVLFERTSCFRITLTRRFTTWFWMVRATLQFKRLAYIFAACALRPDLALLPNGEETEVGEKGITVSQIIQQGDHPTNCKLPAERRSKSSSSIGTCSIFSRRLGPARRCPVRCRRRSCSSYLRPSHRPIGLACQQGQDLGHEQYRVFE